MFKTPPNDLPPKAQKLPTTTVVKIKKNPHTPSPIKARTCFTSRAEEAAELYRKGLENLHRFQNLRKDVRLQIKEALDRLYELTKAVPVARQLEDEFERDSEREKEDKMTQTCIPEGVNEQRRNGIEVKDEGRILAKIEENSRLLLENGRKMEELKLVVEGTQKTILERATYADVAAESQSTCKKPKQASLHSVVVSSRCEEETGEEVLERVRRAVDAKEGWVKVKRVRKAKDRKIVMSCKMEQERKKVKEKLEAAGEGLIVEEVKNRNPLLIMRDVLKVHDDAEVVRALRNQNREVFGGLDGDDSLIEVKYRRKARNPHNCHIILSVSPMIWKRAIDERKIRIDLQRVSVEDQSPLVQCTRCLGYGHSKRFCEEPADLCSHCGGLHLRVECPDRLAGSVPACTNCKRADIQQASHNALSSDCSQSERESDVTFYLRGLKGEDSTQLLRLRTLAKTINEGGHDEHDPPFKMKKLEIAVKPFNPKKALKRTIVCKLCLT